MMISTSVLRSICMKGLRLVSSEWQMFQATGQQARRCSNHYGVTVSLTG